MKANNIPRRWINFEVGVRFDFNRDGKHRLAGKVKHYAIDLVIIMDPELIFVQWYRLKTGLLACGCT